MLISIKRDRPLIELGWREKRTVLFIQSDEIRLIAGG